MSALRQPAPTICPHCGYSNGGAFSVCPICKRDVNQVAHPPRPLVDYAPAFNTRSLRRERIFWRCAWIASSLLFALSLWDLTTAILEHVDHANRANASISKANR